MRFRLIFSAIIFGGLCGIYLVPNRPVALSNIQLKLAVPSVTPTPVEANMSKIKPTDAGSKTPEPLAVQASNVAESLLIYDLPDTASNREIGEPREINRINRVPVKGGVTIVTQTPCLVPQDPNLKVKKSFRPRRHRTPS